MGRRNLNSQDEAERVVAAELDATGEATPAFFGTGEINVWLSGAWSGIVQIQQSFDGGASWINLQNACNPAPLTANGLNVIRQREVGVATRLFFEARISGTVLARISQ